jgi:hypothetical protein
MLYGSNPYRAKAYLRAAERVALLTEPLEDLVVQQRLQDISGVGDAIAGVITQLCQTGSHPSLEKRLQLNRSFRIAQPSEHERIFVGLTSKPNLMATNGEYAHPRYCRREMRRPTCVPARKR